MRVNGGLDLITKFTFQSLFRALYERVAWHVLPSAGNNFADVHEKEKIGEPFFSSFLVRLNRLEQGICFLKSQVGIPSCDVSFLG